jgi:methylenetetrahydrofolate dehydrogenase (NADP+)/methenyltetrahydrofolate cyclohydrolase
MRSYAHDLPADAPESQLLALIDQLNGDPEVSGILVQLPLPSHVDPERVTERIDPRKDVDGFHPYNIGRLVLKRPVLRPCTPYGCMTLMKDTGEDLVGKHAVVIGQSNISAGRWRRF